MKSTQRRRRVAVIPALALAGLVATGVVGLAPAAPAAVPADQADYSGYATSIPVHADVLKSGDTVLTDVEVAFSGAAANSKTLNADVKSEVGKLVSPILPGKFSYGRGSGLEIGLAQSQLEDNQTILAGLAQSSALPRGGDVKQIGPLELDPVANATLLKGESKTNWVEGTCVLGADINNAKGYAADVGLVTGEGTVPDTYTALLALAASNPERSTSNSVSRLQIAPQQGPTGQTLGPDFGLVSETRQTIAPVTLFKGQANELTIEVLGEWVLRAVATGLPGGAYVHYGPADASPETPVVRIIQAGNVSTELTLQQLLGDEGLVIPIEGVGEIAVGEDPRAIGGDADSKPTTASDGTVAAAAVDVVRVKVDALGLADVRVGHFESSAKVPAGGIDCNIPVNKVPTPASVGTGGGFKVDLTVTNPWDCDLVNVVATDDITRSGTSLFRFGAISDGGSSSGGGTAGKIVWNLGTIKAGESKTVSANFTALGGSGAIIDKVTVTGTCGVGSVDGKAIVTAAVDGIKQLSTNVGRPAILGEQLPRTGGSDRLLYLGGLLLTTAGAVLFRKSLAMRST